MDSSSRYFSPQSITNGRRNAPYNGYNPATNNNYDDVFNDQDNDESPQEAPSINGNSMEVVLPRVSASRDLLRHDTVSHRDQGALKAKNRVWEDIANKLLPPEESELMMKFLEKRVDETMRRTYVEGVALPEVDSSAPVPRVGITFLPGADKPQVTRLEQINMAGGEPEQRDAIWRVNTAASLLKQFEVSSDLSIVQRYKRDQIAAVLSRARARPPQRAPSSSSSDSSGRNRTSNSLALMTKGNDAVTIDSDYVKIVHDLEAGDWDLESTLIEVDGSSLLNLMVNYRHLISRGGPDMSFDETRDLLDTMIEDARRLCIRSPVLFRMSTRASIIKSKNTRYGICHRSMFRTLTTSQGIKEIISLSASYFNSLDPTGTVDNTQKLIRPRFLQFIVLLLSLLNDDDLAEIAEFLESTYKLKADRRHLELLFLKVIPLMSINSKVFLQSLVPAFEGFPLPVNYDESHTWDTFIQRILQEGYLLPGTISDLGRSQHSWIVKWPEDGFKSTTVFNNLQYSGSKSRTINDIPPIEVHPESTLNELTVILTNGDTYTIGSADLERITCLTPGTYSVQEAKVGGRNYDLVVNEYDLNRDLYEAIRKTNAVVAKLNILSTMVRRGVRDRILSRRSDGLSFLYECKASGRLTKSVATLNQDILAVTHKIEGRKITTKDSMRTMMQDIREMTQLLEHVERRIVELRGDADKRGLRYELDEIRSHIALAERSRHVLEQSDDLSDEPIAKVLYPGGIDPKGTGVWHDYSAWYKQGDRRLNIEANCSRVMSVAWLSDVNIEVVLHGQGAKVFVTPLRPVLETERNDEIRVGDVVILVGQYLVVADPVAGDGRDRERVVPQDYFMTNWLRIISVEERNNTGRGRNRMAAPERHDVSAFY